MNSYRAEWSEADKKHSPTELYGVLRKVLWQAADLLFEKNRKDEPEYIKVARTKRDGYLTEGRELRLSMVRFISPDVRSLLHAWKCIVGLEKITKSIVTYQKKISVGLDELRAHELDLAWRQRQQAQAWRITRDLSKTPKGASRRWGKLPLLARPTGAQLVEHFAQAPCDGGWSASETIFQDLEAPEPDLRSLDVEPFQAAARSEFQGLRQAASRGRNRRGVPQGEIPGELWKIVLWPQRLRVRAKWGVGHSGMFSPPVGFSSMVARLFATIEATGRAPLQFVVNVGFPVPKKAVPQITASNMFLSTRTVHSYCSLAKSFYNARWGTLRHRIPPDYAYGAVEGRRRGEAISVQLCVAHRLSEAGLSSLLRLFDGKNVFPSIPIDCIKHHNGRFEPSSTARMLNQRVEEHHCLLFASDGEVLLSSGSGVPQGSPLATKDFYPVCWNGSDEYVEKVSRSNPLLTGVCPYAGTSVSTSCTLFVDDMATRLAGKSRREVVGSCVECSGTFDSCMGAVGISQNVEKAEYLSSLRGTGSRAATRELFLDNSHGSFKHCARYLGPQLHHRGFNYIEVQARVYSATQAWYAYRRFWSSDSALSFKRLVFRAIFSTLVSGMTSFALEDADYDKLEKCLCRFMRKLAAGSACKKPNSPEEHHVAMANAGPHRFAGIASVRTELTVARVVWYQAELRYPGHHRQWLTAVAGHFPFQDMLGNKPTNPWYAQWTADMGRLGVLGDAAWLVDAIDSDPMQFIKDPELRADFVQIDSSQLRHSELRRRVPPPGTSFPVGGGRLHTRSSQGPFVCNGILATGTVCGALFDTFQALTLHKIRSKTGSHEGVLHVQALVVTNRCPWCCSNFCLRASARQHARRAFLQGRCTTGCAHVPLPVVPVSAHCRLCDTNFVNNDLYNWHIKSHVSPMSMIIDTDVPLWLQTYWGTQLPDFLHSTRDRPRLGVGGGGQRRGGIPPKARRMAGVDEDIKRLMTLVAKLSLNSAQGLRVIRSIVLKVYLMPSESNFMKSVVVATASYTKTAKALRESMDDKGIPKSEQQQKVLDRLGVPHVHAWNAMVTTALATLKDKIDKNEVVEGIQDMRKAHEEMTEYCKLYQSKGWAAIADEAKVVMKEKAYGKENMKLIINEGAFPELEPVRHRPLAHQDGPREQSAPLDRSTRKHGEADSGLAREEWRIAHRRLIMQGRGTRFCHVVRSMMLVPLETIRLRALHMGLHADGTNGQVAERIARNILDPAAHR